MDSWKVGTTAIRLVQGDITAQQVDVIVNAANSGLWGGGGVDGAIHRRGGPTIMAECDAIRERSGGCPTGEAVATTAGDLLAQWVVHTVGPIWRGGEQREAELLASAYQTSLSLSLALGARTVAFPSLSTGAFGYPITSASRIALRTIGAFAEAHDGALDAIHCVLFDRPDLEVYESTLKSLVAG